jgi:hypothetical protein
LQTVTFFYILFALVLSLSVAFFQYYYKVKNKLKVTIILFVLRTLSLFLLILLLINPVIEKVVIENEKPIVSILVDNSKSISFFKEEKNTADFIRKIRDNKSLRDKFTVEEYKFGSKLTSLDALSFDEKNTNISEAIFEVNQLHNASKLATIVLLSDGNQTLGNNYEFINSKQIVYPVVFGDTTKYKDLKISQLNVNKYSYIKNKFPVEVLLNYTGNETVNTQFSIFNNGKIVFKKKVRFSGTENSKTITANLTSKKEGVNYYTAAIRKLSNEKNIKNNSKNFSVEVIDEQTKIVILTSVLHPDIGAFKKAITSNKQRSVAVFLIDEFKGKLADYQLIILYQPDNQFGKVFHQIKQNGFNYFLISGTNTDWNFINQLQLGFTKNNINEIENYTALYNASFLPFLQKDFSFNQFPPLKDRFGEVRISKEHQNLLFQSINGVATQQPLLTTFEENNQKKAVLFGEGIWQWRATSYLSSNSFQDFDEFTGNLVQYLASTEKRARLEVTSENLYPANSAINIAAFYTDKNYKFDARAALEITITNTETKEFAIVPFSLVNNAYKVQIENLLSGNYTYKVVVIGQRIHKSGRFRITETQIEEQFTNADHHKLEKLANKTGGKRFYKNQVNELIKELLENKSFYTLQKSIVKEQNLINWQWILFFVIIFLSVEWFIRKYLGKI